VIVNRDGEVTHEFAEPLKILLDPDCPSQLVATAARTAAPDDVGDESQTEGMKDGLTFGDAAGSNFEVMVEHSGIEPLTS
jgi:hypothetical protein